MQDNIIKNTPKSQEEISNDQIVAYPLSGRPKPELQVHNRGNDVSVKDDNVKDFVINLSDIDNIIPYYFINIVKPYVIENQSKVNIPVFYAFPEVWKTAQRDGKFKDKEGKVLLPVIIYKRDSIEKRRDLGNRLDGNQAHLYYTLEKKYSQKNNYDRFSILNNRQPVKELYSIAIPDYLTITYNCSIFVNYMEDMNKIIESIMYTSDSYWGDPQRFKFKARIDNIPTINEYVNGTDRIIKSTFDITVNGHIIPDTINKDLSTRKKFYSKAQLIFTMETTDSSEIFTGVVPANVSNNSTTIIDSVNNGGGNTNIDPNTLSYLNDNVTLTAITVTSNSAIFNKGWRSAPSGLPATNSSQFNFFVNGQYINPVNIISFTDNGDNTSTLIINTSNFSFVSNDEITGIGKFAL